MRIVAFFWRENLYNTVTTYTSMKLKETLKIKV